MRSLLSAMRVRFSLKTLLVLSTVFCVCLGAVIKRSNDRRDAVATIRELGGSVIFEHQGSGSEPPGPNWLRELLSDEYFFRVESISLLGPRFNDENSEAIKHLSEARWLSSYSSKITDEGLRHVRYLTNLEEVHFSGLKITDQGMANLSGLKRLNKLQILHCSLELTRAGKDELISAYPSMTPSGLSSPGTIYLNR